MNTRLSKSVLASIAVLAMPGCTTGHDPLALTPDNFGEASRQTLAAQIIDPDPQYEAAVPVTNGDHAEAAISRERAGAVRKPEKQSTTTSSGSGSSGSGGSGGA